MPDNTQTNDAIPQIPAVDDTTSVTPASDSAAADNLSSDLPLPPAPTAEQDGDIPSVIPEVVRRINESHNILVALSSDPSVDEMSAAIGITLFLNRFGKKATAIYSGETPNALEFLKPGETFENTADVLQDFVIALNKDKADHLRYKLDGAYVKIFITPYHERIDEEDLEFSYGDYNVDLVLALDVANGIDLDAALREHGRIMHDASIINITTGNPGKFGDIEWSDKASSSVSEMLAKLLYSLNEKNKMEPEEATAFLTGIVAATDRFSKANTTAECMRLASKLMESGANQQLISENITPDIDNNFYTISDFMHDSRPKDAASLEVEHEEDATDGEKTEDAPAEGTSTKEATTPTDTPSETTIVPPTAEETPKAEPKEPASSEPLSQEESLLRDLQAAADTLATAGAETTPDLSNQPVQIFSGEGTTVEPPAPGEVSTAPVTSFNPDLSNQNPAASLAPEVPSAPEINGVPEMNFNQYASEAVLPPPPAPPVDLNAPLPGAASFSSTNVSSDTLPSAPALGNTASGPAPAGPAPSFLGDQPAMQDQVYRPQASSPDAFKIPGM